MANWLECERKGEQIVIYYYYVELTDSSGEQSTIACALEQHLLHLKKFAYRLDGDNIRFGLNKDLGFDEKSRNENIRRIGEVSVCGTLSYRATELTMDPNLMCAPYTSSGRRWRNSLPTRPAYA